MEEVLTKFQPGVLPHCFVLLTFANLSVTNGGCALRRRAYSLMGREAVGVLGGGVLGKASKVGSLTLFCLLTAVFSAWCPSAEGPKLPGHHGAARPGSGPLRDRLPGGHFET